MMLRKALAVLTWDIEYLIRKHPTEVAERYILDHLKGYSVHPCEVNPILLAEKAIEIVRMSRSEFEVDRRRLWSNSLTAARDIAREVTGKEWPEYDLGKVWKSK
jgi:hypothetical protein